jgi:hypothetical protein
MILPTNYANFEPRRNEIFHKLHFYFNIYLCLSCLTFICILMFCLTHPNSPINKKLHLIVGLFLSTVLFPNLLFKIYDYIIR